MSALAATAVVAVPPPPSSSSSSSSEKAFTVPAMKDQRQQQQPHVWRKAVLGFSADFLSSWTATGFSLLFSHPIDTLRVRRQTQLLRAHETISQHGWRSLYNGLPTPMITTGPSIATAFALNDFFKRAIVALRHDGGSAALTHHDSADIDSKQAALPALSFAELALAGGLAGCASCIVQCPLAVVRIQQQVDVSVGHARLGLSGTVREVFAHAGIRGFYRGLAMEALESGIGRLVYFTAYSELKAALADKVPGLPGQVLAAVGASWIGWVVIYPMDIIKSRVQADRIRVDSHIALGGGGGGSGVAAGRYRGVVHCARLTYKELGFKGLWVGLPTTLARGVLSSGISLPLYDYVRPLYWKQFGVE